VDQGQAAERATVTPARPFRLPDSRLLWPAINRPLTRLSFGFILAMFIKMVNLTKIMR
jgi:hypothetical protein